MQLWRSRIGDIEDLVAIGELDEIQRGARFFIDRTMFPSLGGGPYGTVATLADAQTRINDLIAFAEHLLWLDADDRGVNAERLLFEFAGLGEIIRENHSGVYNPTRD